MTMTNYPAEYGDRWQDITFQRWCEQFWMALNIADWNPRRWAIRHHLCKDFPSAWWLAGLAIDYAEEEAIYHLLYELQQARTMPAHLRSDDHGT